MTTIDGVQLQTFVERIEQFDLQVKAIQQNKAGVYRKARAHGFDARAMKEIVRLRRKDPVAWTELENLVLQYREALGMTMVGAQAGLVLATRARADQTQDGRQAGATEEPVVEVAVQIVEQAAAGSTPIVPPEDDSAIPDFLRRFE